MAEYGESKSQDKRLKLQGNPLPDSPKPVAGQTFKEAWDQYQQTHGNVGDMFAFSKGWQAAQQLIAGQTYAEALTSRAASGKLVDQMDFKAGWHAHQAATREREQALEHQLSVLRTTCDAHIKVIESHDVDKQAIQAAALRGAANELDAPYEEAKFLRANEELAGNIVKHAHATGVMSGLNIARCTIFDILSLDQPGQILLDKMLAKAQQKLDTLRTRLEELANKWRAECPHGAIGPYSQALMDCADELRAALGEPKA